MKRIYVCSYCLQELASHGEKYKVLQNYNDDKQTDCQWCDENDDDLTVIELQ